MTGNNTLVPLTITLLREAGLDPSAIAWNVRVANRKVARRTGHHGDEVEADTKWFSSHEPKRLEGYCGHFISPDRFIEFGESPVIPAQPGVPRDPAQVHACPRSDLRPETGQTSNPPGRSPVFSSSRRSGRFTIHTKEVSGINSRFLQASKTPILTTRASSRRRPSRLPCLPLNHRHPAGCMTTSPSAVGTWMTRATELSKSA